MKYKVLVSVYAYYNAIVEGEDETDAKINALLAYKRGEVTPDGAAKVDTIHISKIDE